MGSGRFQYISCYSLSWSITDNKRLKRVSIHLMLLFIEALLKISGLHIAVSIHLMLLFIFCCWFLWLHIKFVSIHLMLLFIGFRTETVISCIWVSIHLMLLFIPLLTSCKWYILCFNTSHVTLYLCKKEKTKEGVKKFQYISCYSLSYSGFLYC